jgi:hypothetical protein
MSVGGSEDPPLRDRQTRLHAIDSFLLDNKHRTTCRPRYPCRVRTKHCGIERPTSLRTHHDEVGGVFCGGRQDFAVDRTLAQCRVDGAVGGGVGWYQRTEPAQTVGLDQLAYFFEGRFELRQLSR